MSTQQKIASTRNMMMVFWSGSNVRRNSGIVPAVGGGASYARGMIAKVEVHAEAAKPGQAMRLGIATAALLAGSVPLAAQPVLTLAPGETLLEVQATGKVQARPDLMTFSAGVVTTGATTQEALRANAAAASRLIEALRASGVQARDVQTGNIELSPRLDERERDRAREEGQAPRILGYVARNQLQIRFRDLSRASKILEDLYSAGANEVRGPSFTLQEPRQQQRAAERAAVTTAREEADNYAAALGMKVGRVLRISERGSSSERSSAAIVVSGSRIRRTPIEPGEVEVSGTVWVDFALAPQ